MCLQQPALYIGFSGCQHHQEARGGIHAHLCICKILKIIESFSALILAVIRGHKKARIV
jgi:hypothetical protein